jgi:CBS domain-containing protein
MLTVADIMTPKPVMTGPEETVSRALAAMRDRGISSVMVTPPAGGSAYGIVTMRDIITKIVTFGIDPDAVKVGEITSWRLITASPSWSLEDAARQMAQARVRRLPVMDGESFVGLISDTDLFTALVPRHEWEHARLVRKERALHRARQTSPAGTVRDLTSSPVLTIAAEATVQEAIEKMVASGIASLLVPVDEDPAGGIITKRDIVTKVLAQGADPRTPAVRTIMSAPVLTIEGDASIEECSARMSADGVRRFPVLVEGAIAGIISDTDILVAVAEHRWLGHRGRRWPTAHIAADVMRPVDEDAPLPTADAVGPELSVWEAAARLARSTAGALSVIQDGRTIGVVRKADILRALEERGGAD